eukprot:CAMPEP_0117682360 /NCGR_PEP_ID=MMETSP0804-20121206/19606_1 /TAXON_ID=1074897 /ORGANISM="Tetraselmis astigmatica, Strain CCMP880" /LENGTH=129 /DNA_ID=CAMNT_0005492443 /DNA_START=175 /DNA_END=564 /DNA_ORIENTATION=+
MKPLRQASLVTSCTFSRRPLSSSEAGSTFESVFDLAERIPKAGDSADARALHSLFQLSLVYAACVQPEQLSAKYGADEMQRVLSITNRVTLEQVLAAPAPPRFFLLTSTAYTVLRPLHGLTTSPGVQEA